ncbi:hypothetical protein [Ruegeria halocynthiae]|uniref:hypothetical protein n=1 Tax=Ruegeria halocynthiae TaxID=985054 RepID=UPI001F4381DB|nr:hypothetical protein [Ruegeria halocynthiae]
MFRLTLLGCTSALALGFSNPAHAYPIDCAIFLCLAGGWPNDPDCNAARAEFIRRITPMPVEPPLQLWRCPMGVAAGSSILTPMQRLEAIKAASATPIPELPGEEETPLVVEVSFASELWPTTGADEGASWTPLGASRRPWAKLGDGSPALAVPTLASVDLSSSDFDVVRSIRVWHVRHYSYRVREREGPCEPRLDMAVGTYDENANSHWSDRAPGPKPDWLPLRKDCPSYFRGVGVEWSDIFGRYDYELVPY